MKIKKTRKANLENKRTIFFEVGIIVTLAFVLLAFEWTTVRSDRNDWTDWRGAGIEEDMAEITNHKVKKPPMPVPKITPIIVPVSDDVEIEEEIEIDAGNTDGDYNNPYQYNPDILEIEKEEDEIYTIPQNNPEFPGGEGALFQYLAKNLKYTHAAKEIGIQGRLLLSFVVWKDGTIRDIKVERGLGAGLDEEAIRVVRSMPNWIPGIQDGKKVNVKFHMPVLFKLN